jgi:threonine/homoserine/homoserine lactone efflux protein
MHLTYRSLSSRAWIIYASAYRAAAMIAAFFAGLVLGYVGSIPAAGPLALLIVASGVKRDAARALRLALGGAAAESIYALLAFWGLGETLPRYPLLIPITRAAGAALLVLLGLSLLRRKEEDPKAIEPAPQPRRALLLGFSLVALNPGFLMAWTGFAALLASTPLTLRGPTHAAAAGAGAFLGILGWFATLFVLVRSRATRIEPRAVHTLHRAVGVVLLGMGLWLAAGALRAAL